MAKVAKRQGYSYRVTDLDYPAISVATPTNALGAKIGAGKAFAFGRSVGVGVENLKSYYKTTKKSCPGTKWVLGGYSQGALVASRAVASFDDSKVVYVGLFGDPWTNLPEGKGLFPKACFGKNMSSYRVYAPDCRTHTGSLGAKSPYVTSGLENKYGLWCNKNDYVCGSSRSLLKNSGHLQYAAKKEFIWMAEKVEKRLPRYDNGSTTALASIELDEDEIEDLIEAHLSADEYRLGMEGTATIDASQSFSLGHEIVEYQWKINNGDFWSTGAEPTVSRSVFFPNQETITVRVVDDAGRTAETSARIITFEGEVSDDTMPKPRFVTAECVDNEIVINWTEKRNYLARYLLIRVNEIDLDYVPVENLTTTLNGIDSMSEIISIKVAWVDENYNLGEWAEVELVCPEAINIEPVETGVNLPDTSLFILSALLLLAGFIYKKYLPR